MSTPANFSWKQSTPLVQNTILPVCRTRDNPQCFHFQFIGSRINIYVDDLQSRSQSKTMAKADLVFANDLLPAQFSIVIAAAVAEASELSPSHAEWRSANIPATTNTHTGKSKSCCCKLFLWQGQGQRWMCRATPTSSVICGICLSFELNFGLVARQRALAASTDTHKYIYICIYIETRTIVAAGVQLLLLRLSRLFAPQWHWHFCCFYWHVG